MNKSWFIPLLYICLQFEEPRTPVCRLGHCRSKSQNFKNRKSNFG